jgi:DeoR/GlpR family transcriptional regulator of sugar metabolism
VLLADSSKFTTSAMVRICGWDAIDQVIVDDMARPADIDLLERRDVAVDVVATVAAPPGLEAVR